MNDQHVWHSLYIEAMLEPDPEQLVVRVDRAQASITQRLEQGSSGESDLLHEERLALSDAQHNLRALLRKIRPT